MKKLVILTLILAAGLTAYPQSSSRSRESKSKAKSSVSRSSSKSSNSKSRSSAVKSSSSSRSKAAPSRSKTTSTRSKTTSTRSKATPARSSAKSSKAVQSRSSQANRSSAQSRSSQSSARPGTSIKSRSQSVNSRSGVRSSSSSRSSVGRSAVAVRSANRSDKPARVSTVKSSSSTSASRLNRTGNSTYESRDGKKFKHNNNKIFASRKYKVNFRNTSDLRRSYDFRRVYYDYERWNRNRYRRHVVRNYYIHAPLSLEIRRVRYPYRRPLHIDLCWTPWLHQRFVYYYPLHNNWNTGYGNYIESISSYDAMQYAGSVKRVYGKVEEVYYSPEDHNYTLYFGAAFPYHDFSVVIPRRIAKEISRSPTWYFENEHVWVVGLIDVWENKAEIVVNDADQIRRY